MAISIVTLAARKTVENRSPAHPDDFMIKTVVVHYYENIVVIGRDAPHNIAVML